MGSSRLPGKVLMDIAGKTMLHRVIERVRASERIDGLVVAISTSREDDVLEKFLTDKMSVSVFRGSQHNVLHRFYQCAVCHRAEVVVRVTADDPLKDPVIIDRAIEILLGDYNLDYCSNVLNPTYPEGLDIEVFRFRALKRAYQEASLDSEREHVTPYIWKNKQLFTQKEFKSERNLSHWRWTVDWPEDVEIMRRIYEHFDTQPLVSYHDVVAWLDGNPEVQKINTGFSRNSGYLRSLHMEQ